MYICYTTDCRYNYKHNCIYRYNDILKSWKWIPSLILINKLCRQKLYDKNKNWQSHIGIKYIFNVFNICKCSGKWKTIHIDICASWARIQIGFYATVCHSEYCFHFVSVLCTLQGTIYTVYEMRMKWLHTASLISYF